MSLPDDIVAGDLSHESLLYLFRHVFLPPKLPDGDDSSPQYDDDLVGVVQGCLLAFSETATWSERDTIRETRNTLGSLRRLRDRYGHLREDALCEALQELSSPGTTPLYKSSLRTRKRLIFFLGCKSAISVQINEQNAGLTIRSVENGAVFEIFELSPKNRSVLTTKGRLVRLFPAITVHVLRDVLEDPEYQSTIANTMATMSHQRVPQAVGKARKAGQSHEEERETTSPTVVTELLSSILLGFGLEASSQSIRKNTREEVLWNNSKLPWRRSPTWLLVRVTLQLNLQRVGLLDRDIYKKFMVYFMAHILEMAQARSLDSDILHTMSSKIVRRLSKLRNADSGPWIGPIRRAIEKTSHLLDERWLSIRQACEAPIKLSGLSNIDPERDVNLRLHGLDQFLSTISLREDVSANRHLLPESRVQALNQFKLPAYLTLTSLPVSISPFSLPRSRAG